MMNIGSSCQEKDYVSTAWNFHQQKHLLLCNVKEFYQSYNEKFFQNKIGLNSDLSGTLQSSHLVLILYVCALSIKTQINFWYFFSAINKSISTGRDFYKNKNKQMEADKEQEYEHKDETEQNFSLFNATYKNMLTIVVCDVQKMEFMGQRCHKKPKNPTYTVLQEYVELKFQE